MANKRMKKTKPTPVRKDVKRNITLNGSSIKKTPPEVTVINPVAEETLQKKEQIPQKESEPAFKIADRPHYVSIILSIVALSVSLMSWWESRSSRLLNQNSSRAVVYAVELEEINDEKNYGHDYKIIVKNLGRSPAVNIFTTNTVFYSKHRPNIDDYPMSGFVEMLDDIPPNYQKEYEIPFIEGREDENMPELEEDDELYLIGVLDYQDEPSGSRYLQRWCFQLGRNFGEHRVEPEVPSKYQPCPSGY
jgi:hypothetical protein